MSIQMMLLGSGGEGPKKYVDEYFDINVYDGNGSSQTLYANKKNNTSLTDKYAVWIQNRSTSGYGSCFGSSDLGTGKIWDMHTNNAFATDSNAITSLSPSSNYFSIGSSAECNRNGDEYVAWTWSKKEGFFDMVTYVGNGSGNGRGISHNLGVAAGAVLVMPDTNGGDRHFYHHGDPGQGNPVGLKVNSTDGSSTLPISVVSASTVYINSAINQSGVTYYMHLWAHDDKKFGENADESIVYCGQINSSNGAEQKITLGWQPRWILLKNRESADTSGSNEVGKGNWIIMDTDRCMGPAQQNNFSLKANSTSTEDRTSTFVKPVSDGFYTKSMSNSNDKDVVFIAIRDSGDKPWDKFDSSYQTPAKMVTYSGAGSSEVSVDFGIGFNIHESWAAYRHNNYPQWDWGGNTSAIRPKSKLKGTNQYQYNIGSDTSVSHLRQTNPRTEEQQLDRKTSKLLIPSSGNSNASNGHYFAVAFQKMRGLVDFVTYKSIPWSSSDADLTVKHHLGVVPRMMFIGRTEHWTSSDNGWHNIRMYCADVTNAHQKAFKYNSRSGNHGIYDGTSTEDAWNSTAPTATHFTVKKGWSDTNYSGTDQYHHAMLIADADGKVKSGKWDGTGQSSTQSINMGFSPSMIFIWNLHGAGNSPSIYYGEGDSYVWFPSADPARLHLINRHNSAVDTDNYSYYKGFIPVQQISGASNAPLAGSISMSGNNLQVTNFINRNTNRSSVSEVYSWYYLAIK